MADDVLQRLERVEVQHGDYIRVLSSHTSAIAANTASLAAMQQMLGQLVADVAVMRQDVTNIAGRLESLETFLRSKLDGGERR
jgi:uncharacterized protein YceH (UPF0502 family)